MPTVTRISRVLLSVFLSMLALKLLWSVLASTDAAQASRAQAVASLDRDWAPVIVTGTFPGAPVNEIFVYRAVGGVWEQIPFQVDELTASGSYTLTEDGRLDANDEIVFMAGDLGDEATTSIAVSLPVSIPWYQIEVTDPLSPTKQGWAYLVRSSQLTLNTATDYADYITATQRVSATHYSLGWAVSHSGQDYLSLFGGANILDRTKLRVRLGLLTLTENALAPNVILLTDGPVRAIVSRGPVVTRAYASFLHTTTPVSLSASITIDEYRISTDLTSTITNGTYYNENMPGGVTIDGITDTVPATPFLNAWRQVSLDSGTTIQIVDLGAVGGAPSHYYKDNGALDNSDTGDRRSYGDAGVRVISPTSNVFTVESVQYVLPGRQNNRGAEFYEFFRNPLLVSRRLEGGKMVYLPLIVK